MGNRHGYEVGDEVEAFEDLVPENGPIIPEGTKGIVVEIGELLITVDFKGYPTADWEPNDLW